MSKPREMSIEKVQQWVVTALICAVSSFPLGALIIVTHQTKNRDPAGAVILCIMTAVIGVIAVIAVLLMHKRSPWSFLLGLGLLPAIGSAIWTWAT